MNNIFPGINVLVISFLKILLKLGKLWTVVTSKIMIFNQRARDRWKRETFIFKMPSDLFRYDFRFQRYPRVKKK